MSIAIVTPSYGPDRELFRALHASVLEHTDDDVVHHVIVPSRDVAAFRSISSSRLDVVDSSSLLPAGYVDVYPLTRRLQGRSPAALRTLAKIQAVHPARPWAPLRGWILQQVAKIAFAGRLDADVVLLVDSDVVICRHLDASAFLSDGRSVLYRRDDAIDDHMVLHVEWCRTADRLLGRSGTVRPPVPDYIAGFVPWDPARVRAMQRQVSAVTGRHWIDAVVRERHFSECILYGRYLDTVSDDRASMLHTSDTRCLSHWDPRPLSSDEAELFLSGLRPTDLAVQIQSTSDTDPGVRAALVKEAARRLGSDDQVSRRPGGGD